MKSAEDKVYIAGVLVLMGVELMMAIPLVTDSMVKDGSTFLALASIGHLFWWIFGKTGMVEKPLGIPHVLGMMGVFISMLPVVGFIWHGVVAVTLLKYVMRLNK